MTNNRIIKRELKLNYPCILLDKFENNSCFLTVDNSNFLFLIFLILTKYFIVQITVGSPIG